VDGSTDVSLAEFREGKEGERIGNDAARNLTPPRGPPPRENEDKARSASRGRCRMICIQKKLDEEGGKAACETRGEATSPEEERVHFQRGQSWLSVKTVLGRTLRREKSSFQRHPSNIREREMQILDRGCCYCCCCCRIVRYGRRDLPSKPVCDTRAAKGR